MSFVNIKCPSCGNQIQLDDAKEFGFCLYCGTKISLSRSGVNGDQARLRTYIDMCEATLKAKNYDEALNYCNKILAIDPKNIDIWINKAKATFGLTTAENNRYAEALRYLNTADNLAPGNPKINNAKQEITKSQVDWLAHLGKVYNDRGLEIFNDVYGRTKDGNKAMSQCKDYLLKASDYYLEALRYDPENRDILAVIKIMAQSKYVPWSDEFKKKDQHY